MQNIVLNGVNYDCSPVSFPLNIDSKYKGSLVVDDTAPLLYGALSISHDYTGIAPTVLDCRVFSDDGTDKRSTKIVLRSDSVDTLRVEEVFFDSITIDTKFVEGKTSVYFNGYLLRKKNKISKLQLTPSLSNATYVATGSGGGGSCDISDEMCERIKDFFTQNATSSLNSNVSIFEKGVATDITFSYDVQAKDDVITSALFDGVSIISNLSSSSIVNASDTITKSLVVTVESGANIPTINKTAIAYIPQFTGVTDAEIGLPVFTYGALNTNNKFVQASNVLTGTFTLYNEQAFFISRNANANFVDHTNGFSYSVGEWTDTESFIIKKTVTIYLFDGSSETMTLYKMREEKTGTFNIRLQ